VGTDQTTKGFWGRVFDEFKKQANTASARVKRAVQSRSAASFQTRWSKHLNHDVNKFNGLHGICKINRRSGETDEEVLHRAMEMFKEAPFNKEGLDFQYLDCWEFLWCHPKWIAGSDASSVVQAASGSKRKRTPSVTTDEASETPAALPSRHQRPGGRKARKRAIRNMLSRPPTIGRYTPPRQ